MKKYIFLAASVLTLASCSSDDFLGDTPGSTPTSANSAIKFDGNAGKISRANKIEKEAADLLDNNFVVVGFKNSDQNTQTLVFDHYNVNYGDNTANSTASNTKGWEYVGQEQNVKGLGKKLANDNTTAQTIKYWDNSCPSYDFLAFSLGKGYKATGETTTTSYATPSSVNRQTLTSAAYTLNGDANTLGECYISDIKTVEKNTQTTLKGYSNTAVEMSFRHATSKVRIALFENVPGYVINDVKFHDAAYKTGDYTEGNQEGKLFGTFNNNGTLTVYFPTTGITNKDNDDYNKAHIKFTAEENNGTVNSTSFGNVNYGNEEENAITKGSTYLSQSAAKPSYCGETSNQYYITVLPAENESKAATIRIDYTLTATDGSGETIKVKNATATIPAAYTAWKHGYAYTYIFKIAQNTNGTTGTPGSDSEGLTAISFDAVVLDDIETGKQETITNMSECSITTYGFMNKKVTTNNEEYPAGADIYATAYIPEHSCTVEGENTKGEFRAPNKLYTVTIDEQAVQEINESSVLNAIEHGTKDANSDVWTVTDKNGKKLTVTKVTTGTSEVQKVPTEEGQELTINALKWTGTANTVYFVEYKTNCTKKAYKIVKVAAAK